MHDIAFTIGPITIHWYGIMAAIGFLAAVGVVQLKRKYADLKVEQISDLCLITIISGIVGARLFYVVQFWGQFRNNLLKIFRIDQGGLVYYGGFIFAVVAMMIYARLKKRSLWKILDIAGPGLALGHAIGRIGCLMRGCCFGKPTSMPWGVVFPPGSPPAEQYSAAKTLAEKLNHTACSVPLHPVQLYECLGNLIIFGILFYLVGKLKKGQVAALYFLLYGILRFSDEFFRGDSRGAFFGVFSPAQTICLFMIPIGIILIIYTQYADNGGKEQKSKADSK